MRAPNPTKTSTLPALSMRRGTTALALAASLSLLSGCEGRKFDFAGTNLWQRFVLDGDGYSWTYSNENDEITDNLVTTVTGRRNVDGLDVVNFSYALVGPTAEDGTPAEPVPLFDVEWSADSVGGIQVWSYADHLTDTAVVFDEPLVFADPEMNANDTVSSQSNGVGITTTFVSLGELGNAWTTDPWDSAHLVVDDGDGDDDAGLPFAGHWWLTSSKGVNQFVPTGFTPNAEGFDPNTGDAPVGENWYLTKAVLTN